MVFVTEADLIEPKRCTAHQSELLRLECAAEIALDPLVELVELHLAILFSASIHFLRILLLELVDEELRLAEDLRYHAYFKEVALCRLVVHAQVKLDLLQRLISVRCGVAAEIDGRLAAGYLVQGHLALFLHFIVGALDNLCEHRLVVSLSLRVQSLRLWLTCRRLIESRFLAQIKSSLQQL